MINLISAYGGQKGHFGIISGTNQVTFHHCRDNFQGAFGTNTNMAYVHGGDKSLEQIIEFIQYAEKIAGIKDGADFEETNLNNTVHIDLHFWCSQKMRLSLFTLLLRGGLNYPTLESAIALEPYMRPTCGAIGRFLSGYTCFTGAEQRWYDVFVNADDKKVEKMLIKEPTLDFDEGILGFGKQIIKASNKRGAQEVKLQAVCELLEEMVKKKAEEA